MAKKSPPADLDTLQRVRVVLAEAMKKGQDAAEALDHAGLLDHAAKSAMRTREIIIDLANLLDELNVGQVASAVNKRHPTSTLDMKRIVVSWLLAMATGDLPK